VNQTWKEVRYPVLQRRGSPVGAARRSWSGWFFGERSRLRKRPSRELRCRIGVRLTGRISEGFHDPIPASTIRNRPRGVTWFPPPHLQSTLPDQRGSHARPWSRRGFVYWHMKGPTAVPGGRQTRTPGKSAWNAPQAEHRLRSSCIRRQHIQAKAIAQALTMPVMVKVIWLSAIPSTSRKGITSAGMCGCVQLRSLERR